MSRKFTAAGVTSGVGSMLIGAKELGFEILGNVEWRNYYNTGTFEKNFNAPYTTDYDNIDHLVGADIVMVHDDCGAFSPLNTSRNKKSAIQCQGHIPQTIEAVKKIDPNFFAIDNLPKMIEIFPAQYWIDNFPDYDIYFEWVSNYHYGNPQKYRKRFFIIGAKKKFNFVFKPNEYDFKPDMDIYSSRCEGLKNHIPVNLDDDIQSYLPHQIDDVGLPITTWRELSEYAKKSKRKNLPYISSSGTIKLRPGTVRNSKDYSSVVAGTIGTFHHDTGLPLTIRERANIQGFPRDFEFVLTEREPWSGKGFRQVGKAMPVQFTTYITKLFLSYLDEYYSIEATNERFIAPNNYVDKIKLEYCSLSELPESACESCWLQNKCDNYL